MSAWKRAKAFIEGLGIVHSIHGMVTSEFVRTALLPTVSTVSTALAGYLGDAPVMWIIMASALTFMGVSVSLVAGFLLAAQNTPENKLTHQAVFQVDLNVVPAPLIGNRQQRRAVVATSKVRTMLSSRELSPHASRTMEKGQLGLELTNNGTFPISCFLASRPLQPI